MKIVSWPPLPRWNGGIRTATCRVSRSAMPGRGRAAARGPRARGGRPRRASRAGRHISRRAALARLRGLGAAASLERQRGLHRPAAGLSASRAPRRRWRPAWCAAERASSARAPRRRIPCSRIQRIVAGHLPRRAVGARSQRLDMAARLAQAAVLVEVALHELVRPRSRARAARPRRDGRPWPPASSRSRPNAWSSA